MKKYILFILLISLAQLFSYSLLERYEGNYIDNVDARAAAMGGATTAGGYRLLDAVVNPANLSFMEEKIGFQMGFGLMKNEDNRKYPMFNFFDGYVEDATYATNVDYFGEFTGGIYYKHQMETLSLVAGFIFRPWNSFDCNYDEQVRNDEGSDFDSYPPIIANNFIEGQGMINAMSLNLGLNYNDQYSLGVEVSNLSGDNTLERRIIWSEYANQHNADLTDEIIKYKKDYQAVSFKIGALAKVNSRFSFGASYTPTIEFDEKSEIDVVSVINSEATLSDDYYLDPELSTIYPSKIRLGMNYLPRNVFKTNFNFDFEIVNWNDVNDLYDSEFNYYLGIEHKLNKSIPLRIGFKYLTSYHLTTNDEFIYAKKMSWPVFTAGTGFDILTNFVLDLSLEYATRNYEELDLFMDGNYNQPDLWNSIVPEDRGWENPDTVNQTFLKLQTSITYKW